MAKDKKSVIVYVDWISTFEELDDAEAGKLIKHFFRYVNDQNPEPPDRLTKLVFEPIKSQLKRDLMAYEQTCIKNKENAEKRWQQKNATACDRIKQDAKNADTDIDTDIDTETDNDTELSKDNVRFAREFPELHVEIMEYFGFTEMRNPDKLSAIFIFLNILYSDGLLQSFKLQFEAYKTYKAVSRSIVHSFTNFLGSIDHRFKDGGWNQENWGDKLEKYSQKLQGPESISEFNRRTAKDLKEQFVRG